MACGTQVEEGMRKVMLVAVTAETVPLKAVHGVVVGVVVGGGVSRVVNVPRPPPTPVPVSSSRHSYAVPGVRPVTINEPLGTPAGPCAVPAGSPPSSHESPATRTVSRGVPAVYPQAGRTI